MKLSYLNLFMLKEHKYWTVLAIIVPLVLVLGVALGSYQVTRDYLKSFTWVEDAYQIIDDMNCIQSHLINSESSVRGYILSGDESFLTPYYRAKEVIPSKLAKVQRALEKCPEEKENLETYLSLLAKKNDIVEAAVVRRLGKPKGSVSLNLDKLKECEATTSLIRDVSRKMRDHQLMILRARQMQSARVAKNLLIATSILMGLLAVFTMMLVMLFIRLKRLHSLVTVCSMTHKVLHEGEWLTMEQYLENRFGLNVSHGISEDAARKIIEEIRVKHNGSQAHPFISES